MGKPLRVLIVEDSEDDALLVIRELERGGYDTTFERVETAEAMTAALENQVWDIIISDYKMPHFSAPEALKLFQQSGMDLPFIVVSGTIGEETAVATMKAGAHDYLMKGNLTRLVPVIERELHEAEVRKERKLVQEELWIAEQNFRNSLDSSPLGIRIVSAEGELLYANQAILDIYGYSSVEELKAVPTKQRYTPESYAEHQERKERRKLGKPVPPNYEISIIRKDGEIRHLVLSRKEVVWGGEVQYQVIHQDITERKRAEEALRQSEESLKTYLESAPDAVYINNLKGTFLYGNKKAEEILRYNRKELIGKSFLKLNLLSAKYLARAGKLLALNAMGRSTGPDEFELIRSDGSRVWVEINTTPIKQAEEKVVVIGFVRDITERKRAEDEIRESRDYLERLTNSMWDTVFLVRMPERVIEWVNDSYNLIGYDSEECVGSTTEFLYPNKNEFLDFGNKLRNAIDAGKDILHSKQLVRRKSGEVFPADITATIIRNREGKVVSVTSIIRDVTEAKKAVDDLKQAAEEWRTTFDSIVDLVSIHDKDFRIIRVNKAFANAFNMKPEELIGKTCYQVVHGTNEPAPSCPHMKTLETKEPAVEDFFEPHLGIHLEIATSPIFNEQGEVVASVHVARDITERKQAEEEKKKLEAQLQQAQKMEAIGTLAGGIAHDFNNILSLIIGYTELTMRDLPEDSRAQDNMNKVFKASERARDLVKQILAFSRHTEQEQKPVQIHLIFKEALKLLRPTIPTTIEIHQNITSTGTVMADPTQMHQVLMNLSTNAYHAMSEKGGILEVSLTDIELDSDYTAKHLDSHSGPYLKLTVSDTGHGMEKKVLDRIFDPYYTTKEKTGGTGMGLAVLHGIVKSHGGVISVYSEPGKGTTFNVFFPRIEAAEGVVEPEEIIPLPIGKERILLVDDEPAIVDIGKGMLEHLGYTVVTRTSSIEALEAFKAQPDKFDLVITDMTMPKMTGDELAKELMRIRPDLPIILCTGFSESINEEKAKAMGIRAFVMKPVIQREMANAVRKALDS